MKAERLCDTCASEICHQSKTSRKLVQQGTWGCWNWLPKGVLLVGNIDCFVRDIVGVYRDWKEEKLE